MSAGLIEYQIARRDTPEGEPGQLYSYWLAGNGVWATADRPGLSVCIPIGEAHVVGLPEMAPYVQVGERVPAEIVADMFIAAREVCIEENREALFYLKSDSLVGLQTWQLLQPTQIATATSVIPTDTRLNRILRDASVIDVHSHHVLPMPNFSSVDDASQSGTFRIYGLLSNIFEYPTLRARVQVFSHCWDFPVEWVFEIPKGVHTTARPRRPAPAPTGRGLAELVRLINEAGGRNDPLPFQVPGLRRRPGR